MNQDNWRVEKAIFPMFHRVHEALIKLGIEPYPLYYDLDLLQPSRTGGLPRVSIKKYIQLLTLASQKYDIPCIGVEIAKVRDINSYELLSGLLKNSPTFSQVVSNINSFARTITPGARALIGNEGNYLKWIYYLEGFSAEESRHEVEMTIVEIIFATRALIKKSDWRPIKVCFKHSSCGKDDYLKELVGCNVYFSQDNNFIQIDRDLLKFKIPGASKELYRFFLNQIGHSNPKKEEIPDFIEELDFYLANRIGFKDDSAKSIAKDFGISLRKLYRILDELNINFRDFKNSKKIEIAKSALKNSETRISEIAFLLGYSDPAAFNRAFKRETSLTPLQYRSQ